MDQSSTIRAPVTGTRAVLLWQSLMPTYSWPAATTLTRTSAAFSVASEG